MEILGLGLVLAAAALAAAGASWWRSRRYVVHRRVVVNLRSGTAVAGVITETRGPLLIVRDATVHDGDQAAPADGEIVIDRAAIDYIQAL
ncbi:hypothetical protein [Nocardia arizonensis]|uniref:hypothetical protein n=1 Tax=Nocardia arizonensis TaxID=1141647 RepID=UPI0006CF97BD|nr:hypothetical protein [Nocardia arizonensis]